MLIAAADGGAHDGDWLVADQQTAGRGRLGRSWHSQAGNLFASTLVRLRGSDPALGGLSLAAGLALVEAVGESAVLKWPNDLMVGNAKVAGILLERSGDAVVIGFGVNLVSSPDIAGRLTSFIAKNGVPLFARDAFLDRLVASVTSAVCFWREHGTAAVARRWEAVAHQHGDQLTAFLPDGDRISGAYDGLTDDGALRLYLADGAVRVIYAGDIFIS